MSEFESVRATAAAIGRITCIKTGEEIGLLYRWDNGETQSALYAEDLPETLNRLGQRPEPDIGANRG